MADSVERLGVDWNALEETGADCVVVHHFHKYFPPISRRVFLLGDFVFRDPLSLPAERESAFLELTIGARDNDFEATLHRYVIQEGIPSKGLRARVVRHASNRAQTASDTAARGELV